MEGLDQRPRRAGDLRHGSIERVASAVAEGSTAVKACHEHLDATANEEAVVATG